MIQFNAQFDGKYLCPDEPVTLPENVTLRVTVVETGQEAVRPANNEDLFERLENQAGLIDGPTDWAAEHDHYLYGVPKHGNGAGE
jgi:hypothetical protein